MVLFATLALITQSRVKVLSALIGMKLSPEMSSGRLSIGAGWGGATGSSLLALVAWAVEGAVFATSIGSDAYLGISMALSISIFSGLEISFWRSSGDPILLSKVS